MLDQGCFLSIKSVINACEVKKGKTCKAFQFNLKFNLQKVQVNDNAIFRHNKSSLDAGYLPTND